MPKWLRLILIVFCAGLLVGVRAFEEYLFYDPFILFFKDEYHSGVLPESHLFKLIAFTSLRYFINTLLSLSVLFLVFKNIEIIRFSVWLYLILFVLLMVVYGLLSASMEGNSQLLSMFFYIRRFLIQPVFLLLLLPAFYFYGKVQRLR